MPQPDIENLRIWVAALRSGNFKQTYQALSDASGECCLGVACRVYVDETGDGAWITRKQGGRDIYGFGAENATVSWSYLPNKVQAWLGITGCDPKLDFTGILNESHPDEEFWATASEGNDEVKATFTQIADAIEATWPEVRV